MKLESLVLNVASQHAVTHAQLVKEVLASGYHHRGDLSSDLHLLVKRLERRGKVEKDPETRVIKVA